MSSRTPKSTAGTTKIPGTSGHRTLSKHESQTLASVTDLASQRKWKDAAALLKQALSAEPENGLLWQQLGAALQELGQGAEAVSALTESVRLEPQQPKSWALLGGLLRVQGRLKEAIHCHQTAQSLEPAAAASAANLATTLQSAGQHAAAVDWYKKALELKPEWLEIMDGLAHSLMLLERFKEALPVLMRVAKAQPDSQMHLAKLAAALREANQPGEAVEIAEILVRQSPENYAFRLLLGACLSRVGRCVEAMEQYSQARRIKPEEREALQIMVYVANYLPHKNPADLYRYYQTYSEIFERPLQSARTPIPPREKREKIRVGYVSGDFCRHPVASFIEPVFDRYDRSAFEVYCYYSCPKSDAVTARLRALVDQWRDVPAVSDDALAALVREDQIDILVDLAGHTRLGRPLVFARKPAPVQVTMIGCMQTTGLKSIDYRITDAELDPPGVSEAYNSETLVRMKTGAVCFKPDINSPPVKALPALHEGVFTFGSYNNLAKITPQVLDVWSEVLRQCPSSRMILIADSGEYLRNNLALRGISRSRIELLPRMLEREYLESHHRVDLILDTFPFNGLTVSMNALWMGVPCVTLQGNTSASRAGGLLQSRVDLSCLVASTAQEYVAIAVRHARDPEFLATAREGLREKMRVTWTDAAAYTAELETRYREMLADAH
jgi:predicted O-linked N-acetylglucosamine transferase (SPINDLY family)